MFESKKSESDKSQARPASLNQGKSSSYHIQTKLNIGQPNDQYEQEADQVADKVVNKSNATQGPAVQKMEDEEIQTLPITKIQRQPEEEVQARHFNSIQRAEDEEVQARSIPGIQRMEDEEVQAKPIIPVQRQPEEELQAKPDQLVQREAKEELQMKPEGGQPAPQEVSNQIDRSKGGGSPLSSPVRTQMESGIGADFSGVRIHTGSNAENMSQQLNAQAFTVGSDVYFNKGKFNPGSQSGQHLLAHELTHTVQQGKSQQTSIQRELDFGPNAEVVGYKFVVGTDLTLTFLQLAQSLTKDNTVTTEDLMKLRAWGIKNEGTVHDQMRMFLAGILAPSNRATFNATKLKAGVKFTFPFSTITSARRKQINDLGREVDTSEIDQLDYEAKEALIFEGHEAMGQKLNERDTAIETKLLVLATGSYQQAMTDTIAFAKANGISLPELLQATINAASDSTAGDRVMAAIAFTVSKAAGLSNSSHLMSGKLQVDAIVPSAFKALLGQNTMAGYSTQGGAAGKIKGDTLYLQNIMDIKSLSHRSTIIHEMTHAQDDENQDLTKAPVDTSILDLEYKAYKAQANYILEQVAKAAPADKAALIKQVTKDITSIINAALIYETYTNKAKYTPVLVEIVKVQSGNKGGEQALVNKALTQPRSFYKTKFEAAINVGYGLNKPGAQTTVPLDGLAGSSLIDWINRIK